MNAKVIGYIRVSSEKQVENYSLDTQKKLIRNYCKSRGHDLVKVFQEEGASAKTLQRPALIDCLNYAQKNKKKLNHLIVYRLDRLSRETHDYIAVRKKLSQWGIELLSVSEPTGQSPTDRFLETIIASMAQLDNEIRGERALNGMKARFEAGWAVGKPPVGYISSTNEQGRLIHSPDPEMFDKVKEAWQVMATGTKTLREMAEYMEKLEIKIRYRGKRNKINHQTAARVFTNPYYMGLIKSPRWGERKGNHLPMIDGNTFFTVQKILKQRDTNSGVQVVKRLVVHPDFPLRRIVLCGKCGKGLTGGWSRGRHGGKFGYYFCTKYCTKSIKRDDLHNQTIELLKKITPSAEAREIFTLIFYYEFNARKRQLEKSYKESQNRIEEIGKLRTEIALNHAKKIYTDETFKKLDSKLENELLATNITNHESILAKYDIEEICNFCYSFLEDLSKPFVIGDPGQKRTLLGILFNKSLIWDNGLLKPPKLASFFKYLGGSVSLGGTDGT